MKIGTIPTFCPLSIKDSHYAYCVTWTDHVTSHLESLQNKRVKYVVQKSFKTQKQFYHILMLIIIYVLSLN